ncbi:hypothetical protein BKM25_23085 [Pseudomonas avellanae]|nr:hypothetical protein AO261_28610 [Pseudomonas avellanae]POR73162.1 hypothetical protein BKM25_23085 [Pseudomonas avellanae]
MSYSRLYICPLLAGLVADNHKLLLDPLFINSAIYKSSTVGIITCPCCFAKLCTLFTTDLSFQRVSFRCSVLIVCRAAVKVFRKLTLLIFTNAFNKPC